MPTPASTPAQAPAARVLIAEMPTAEGNALWKRNGSGKWTATGKTLVPSVSTTASPRPTHSQPPQPWASLRDTRPAGGPDWLIADGNTFVIGRAQDQTANRVGAIKDDRVSKQHCTIARDADDRTSIMDTSFNGTKVNGKALPKGVAQPLVAGDVIECGCSRAAGKTGGVSVLSFVFLRPVMQKILQTDDATLHAHAHTPTIMAGPHQTNPVGQSQPPDGNDNANNQYTDTTRQNQHSILEGGIATRTHNHLPISSNGTMNHDKLPRMNDTETPHEPDATLAISPPIGVEVANGDAADIVPGTNDKSCKTQKETTCMLTGPDTTSIQGDDALVHASQAHPPLSGTNPPPTGSGLSGQQNTDTPDVSTHAALHV